MSKKTVESHRENIKHKLPLGSSVQLRERAAKWVEEISGRRKSGKQPVHPFWERKPFLPKESEGLHRRHQQERPVEASHAVSVHIPDSAATRSLTKLNQLEH
ncbi:MAG TPA: hypothetical protein VGM65_02620 [Candidatus Udaeobacter sp.]